MRTIDSIDFFYLSMPEIKDISDGSQDVLLVRITAGGEVGWGECEAAPLVTIASLVCPMSHSACKPVGASVLGQRLESPEDIRRIHQTVRANSMDLLQADHTLSGIDVALWDLLGKVTGQPVYALLGFERANPKIPYLSLLFGDTAEETRQKAEMARTAGYRALKFGWGPFGHLDVKSDVDQLMAAREGLGPDGILLVDAGTVWVDDVEEAARRIQALEACRVEWLEEPFHTGALQAYKALSQRTSVRLAGGEGAHNEYMAYQMIDYANIGYVQIDVGRVGGITAAKRVYDHATARGVTYVNHTFTSHLALSASLQPFAGGQPVLCEYPGQLSPLAYELTCQHLSLNDKGEVILPDRPGLGIEPDLNTVRKYLVDVEIKVNGQVLYETPAL
ncbi:MAG: mandelate racemase/muconate lactonizing enzyme family protein [Chloroflexi bacterium]|nr:mandelate racemase/muconate lactonizing enzyme family protein [Chloroflexota bacterium]